MSDTKPRHPVTLKRVVYHLEGMEAVPVQHDVAYRRIPGGALTMDIYRSCRSPTGVRAPVVLFVAGYPDVGGASPLGCRFKDMEMSVSLAQLVAMSGMTAIAYTTSDPATDVTEVLGHLDRNASALHVDTSRVGLWAVSGNVPVALSVLTRQPHRSLKAAVFSNGFTLDLQGTGVADAARAYGFANPCAGDTVDHVPSDVPLFITRSGQDEIPGLNEALDVFVAAAIGRNLPVTFANHPTAPHCFELHDESEVSRRLIAHMLEFMRFHLA